MLPAAAVEQVLTVEPRVAAGKGGARKARAQGKVPGVLYGHGQRPLSFSVNPADLSKQIHASGLGVNTVLRVKGLEREELALLKDSQVDPVKRRLIHIDLIAIREDEDVVVSVPIEFTGKPIGVVNGGVFQPVRREITLACKPLSIPRQIAIDVTNLDINKTVHVSDVVLPEGTKMAMAGRLAIATVASPAAEEEVAPAEGAVEGAVPAEGEAAAAAAAPAAEEGAEKKKK
jgi:large subunit ribosomal protein L25